MVEQNIAQRCVVERNVGGLGHNSNVLAGNAVDMEAVEDKTLAHALTKVVPNNSIDQKEGSRYGRPEKTVSRLLSNCFLTRLKILPILTREPYTKDFFKSNCP
jgi:hypothetical protein